MTIRAFLQLFVSRSIAAPLISLRPAAARTLFDSHGSTRARYIFGDGAEGNDSLSPPRFRPRPKRHAADTGQAISAGSTGRKGWSVPELTAEIMFHLPIPLPICGAT